MSWAALLRRKVGFVSMEVVASDCPPLYVGQERCAEVVAFMRSIGYELNPQMDAMHKRCTGWREGGRRTCELDIGFERRHLEASEPPMEPPCDHRCKGIPD